MSYDAEHRSALADVKAAGVAMTFRPAPGVTGSAVSGYGMQIEGDPKRYESLSLVESDAPTLFFVPSTFGERPALGSQVTFGGEVFVVKDESPFMPAGRAIYSTVVVA